MAAAPSAAQRYWASMAQLRATEPVVPAVGSKLQTCSVDLGGSDAMYMSRCLAAWREVTSAPTAQSAQQVFARDYYRWLQRYLREALARRSDATADASGRVIWALDVWARVQYALFALNFAWGEVYRKDTSAKIAFVPRVLAKLGAAYAQEQKWVDASRRSMVEHYALASSAETQRAAAAAKLMPVPFGELAVEWVGESRAQYARKANPLWGLLLDAVRPWSDDWHAHWLASKGGKDKAEVALAVGDPTPMLSVALMQWRLWSVQDFASDQGATSAVKTGLSVAWPLRMGTRFSCATLLSYLSGAATESSRPEVVLVNSRAYPNLAHGLSLLAAYAGVIADVDFDQETTDYLGKYLTRFRPPFRDDGTQMTRGELATASGGAGFDARPLQDASERNRLAPIPVTYGDYREYIRGLAVIQPPACAAGDKTCELSLQARQKLAKTPAGSLQKQLNKAVSSALNVLGVGGAVGGGSSAVYGLPNPFARSFGDEAYKTAITGKTTTALARLPRAIANLELLMPGLFTSGALTQVVPAQDCTTYFYGPADTPCEVCAGQWPPCAEHVPGLRKPAAASGGQSAAEKLGYACHTQWVAWLTANPEAAHCFPLAGDPAFRYICGLLQVGKFTADEAESAWLEYASQKCPQLRGRGRGAGLELFGRYLVHAGTFGIL